MSISARYAVSIPTPVDDAFGGTKTDYFGSGQALVIDRTHQNDYVNNIELLDFDVHDISGTSDALALPFHLINLAMSAYMAGFVHLLIGLLTGLTCVSTTWFVLLEHTFFQSIFAPGYDLPSALSIISLLVAFALPRVLADNAATFTQPQQTLRGLLLEITQIARKLARVETHRRISGDLLKEVQTQFENCFDCLLAATTYTLRLFLMEEDAEEDVFSPLLQERITSWQFDSVQVPETIDYIVRDVMTIVTGLEDRDVFLEHDREDIGVNVENIVRITNQFKDARDIKSPDVFSNFMRLALTVYIVVALPIIIYSSVKEYMIPAYVLIVSIMFGSPFYRWWIGGPFGKHARFAGIPFYKWRTEAFVKIFGELCIVTRWMQAGPVRFEFMDHIRAQTVGVLNRVKARDLIIGAKSCAVQVPEYDVSIKVL